MEFKLLYISLMLWSYLLTTFLNCVISHVIGPQEYCTHDTFNATCPGNKVIIMETALYGRMRFGRCMQENHGHVGCSSNIISVLDHKCSGIRSCSVKIPIADLRVDECPKELMHYLEASYRCQHVVPVQECGHQMAGSLKATNKTNYLQPPSYTTGRNFQGTRRCPWEISAQPGQQINLTLLNFNTSQLGDISNNNNKNQICNMFAIIVDNNSTKEVDVCSKSRRESMFYISRSHHITVFIVLHEGTNRNVPKFLLTYKAIGCADLSHLKNAWVARTQSTLTVKCNFSGETFFLSCSGNKWIGQLHNCTGKSAAGIPADKQQNGRSTKFNFGLLILVGIGVALGVALGIILLAGILTCFRRRKQQKMHMVSVSRHTSDPLLSEVTRDSDDASNYYERRVQTLATIGRSPRVPREAIYKERGWMSSPTHSHFHTLPFHYNMQQPRQQGTTQHVHAQIESPYCTCVQNLPPPPPPMPPTAPSNLQSSAQTSFITFRPGEPSGIQITTRSEPPCGTGIRHITAARSLDLLKDSDHHSNNNPRGANIITSSNSEDTSCTCKPSILRPPQNSDYQSNGYFDNSNNKSI